MGVAPGGILLDGGNIAEHLTIWHKLLDGWCDGGRAALLKAAADGSYLSAVEEQDLSLEQWEQYTEAVMHFAISQFLKSIFVYLCTYLDWSIF